MSSYYVIFESAKLGLDKKPLYSVVVNPSNIRYDFRAQTFMGVSLSIPKSEFKIWKPLKNSRVYLSVGDSELDVESIKKNTRLFFVGLSSVISESNENDVYEISVARIDQPALSSSARGIEENITNNQTGNARELTQKIYNGINNFAYFDILVEQTYSDSLNLETSKNANINIKRTDTTASLVEKNNRRNQMFNMIDFAYNEADNVIFKAYFNNSIDNRQNELEPIPFTLIGEGGYSEIANINAIHGAEIYSTYQYSYITRLGKASGGSQKIRVSSKKIYNMAGLENWALDVSINHTITEYFTEAEIREFKQAFENASNINQVTVYLDKIKKKLTIQAISRWYRDIMQYYQLKVVLANQNILIDKRHYNEAGLKKYPNQNEIWSVGTLLYLQDKDFFGSDEKMECTIFSGTAYQENNNKFVELVLQPNLNIQTIDFDKELHLTDLINSLKTTKPDYKDKDVFEYLIDNIQNYPLQLKLYNPTNYNGIQIYSGQDY